MIREINDKDEIEKFIEKTGETLRNLTSFETIKTDSIEDYLLTSILYESNQAVAYGHLRKDGVNAGLDVCVVGSSTRKNFGEEMIVYLLEEAAKMKIGEVSLSTHRANKEAISLYEKLIFIKHAENENFLFFKKKTSQINIQQRKEGEGDVIVFEI